MPQAHRLTEAHKPGNYPRGYSPTRACRDTVKTTARLEQTNPLTPNRRSPQRREAGVQISDRLRAYPTPELRDSAGVVTTNRSHPRADFPIRADRDEGAGAQISYHPSLTPRPRLSRSTLRGSEAEPSPQHSPIRADRDEEEPARRTLAAPTLTPPAARESANSANRTEPVAPSCQRLADTNAADSPTARPLSAPRAVRGRKNRYR
jgi:hypothetical protein